MASKLKCDLRRRVEECWRHIYHSTLPADETVTTCGSARVVNDFPEMRFAGLLHVARTTAETEARCICQRI